MPWVEGLRTAGPRPFHRLLAPPPSPSALLLRGAVRRARRRGVVRGEGRRTRGYCVMREGNASCARATHRARSRCVVRGVVVLYAGRSVGRGGRCVERGVVARRVSGAEHRARGCDVSGVGARHRRRGVARRVGAGHRARGCGASVVRAVASGQSGPRAPRGGPGSPKWARLPASAGRQPAEGVAGVGRDTSRVQLGGETACYAGDARGLLYEGAEVMPVNGTPTSVLSSPVLNQHDRKSGVFFAQPRRWERSAGGRRASSRAGR